MNIVLPAVKNIVLLVPSLLPVPSSHHRLLELIHIQIQVLVAEEGEEYLQTRDEWNNTVLHVRFI